MTFIPHFKFDSKSNIIFADIAGLNDTSGILIDVINCFINRIIFRHSKKIKLLIGF